MTRYQLYSTRKPACVLIFRQAPPISHYGAPSTSRGSIEEGRTMPPTTTNKHCGGGSKAGWTGKWSIGPAMWFPREMEIAKRTMMRLGRRNSTHKGHEWLFLGRTTPSVRCDKSVSLELMRREWNCQGFGSVIRYRLVRNGRWIMLWDVIEELADVLDYKI